ncbi:MAG TPA: ROK family protein [Candidatus Andersenbacteria bacterium]|nr:ROK family protein [Candidatus Andersenbacteria bacterium]
MYLLIDIGGTKTRVAISRDGTKLDAISRCPTEQDLAKELEAITTLAGKLTGDQPLDGAAVALPGVLNQARDTLLHSPNLSQWENKPLRSQLETAVGVPVSLANDAAAAGLGEASFGAGQKYNIVAYLTISTGIGGARIVNRRIDPSHAGFEPGHSIIDIDGTHALGCPAPTTLEDTLGGNSILKRYQKKSEEIKDPAFWESFTNHLAIGLNNVIAFWSPDIIVLGGSQMNDVDLAALRQMLATTSRFSPDLPALRRATLGDEAGLWGALALLENKTSQHEENR